MENIVSLIFALLVFGGLMALVEYLGRRAIKQRGFRYQLQRGALGGVIGNGSRIGYSLTSPTSYTRIGQVKDVGTFLALVAAAVDTTVMGSSNIMTVAPGMIAAPKFAFTLLADFDPSTSPTHEFLRNYQSGSGQPTAGTALYFAIEVPINRGQTSFRKWEFQGYVSGFTPKITTAGVQTVDIEIQFQGSYAVYPPAAATIN